MRGKRTTSWGDDAWDTPASSWPTDEITSSDTGYMKYRALYEFVARNTDELSFQPGDVIMVTKDGSGEPGWLSGELRGATGWFPESYVEPISGTTSQPLGDASLSASFQPKTPLEGIAEVSESEGDGLPAIPPFPDPILGMGQPVSYNANANHTFTGTAPNMLPFFKGDVISVSEVQDQWFYGEVNGMNGWFPKSYVTVAETLELSEPITANGQEYYIATYPYQSEESGDLTFEQGQLILVVSKDGDWWTGTIGNATGIFPSNYVQKAPQNEVPVEPEPEPVPVIAPVEPVEAKVTEKVVTPVTLEPQPTSVGSRTVSPEVSSASGTPQPFDMVGSGEEIESKGKIKKPEIATVIAPYQSTSSEQLSLQRGQLIMIRKKSTTGWWEGELQAKGRKRQIGWFPASYVKLLGGGTSSSQAKSPSPGPNKDSTATDTNTEKVVALYDYQAQNEDELNFEKDDIITVVSRDEPAWWKGELKGAIGLFPSNYVGPVSNRISLYDPNGNMPVLTKGEEQRQLYIKELITTEQAYIDDMSIVQKVFEKPLTESGIISNEEVRSIFVNWDDILECNYTFLRSLRVRRENSLGGIIRMIGDIICENIPRMTVYVRFCSCQLSAAAILQSLTENNKDFKSFVQKCQSDPRTNGMPLSSFLIKPMQRITKYPLLISKIVKQTPSNHPDHHYLEEALYRAEELCSQVNEGVREKENCERLEWLQTHIISDGLQEPLIFNSLTNCVGPRKLLHHGILVKTKSGKELVGFLMNDFLLLSITSRPLGQQFSFEKHNHILLKIYRTPLLLSELTVLNNHDTSDQTEFRVEYNKKVYQLNAISQNERNLWLKKLQEAQRELRMCEKAKFQRQRSIRGRIPKGILSVVLVAATFIEQSILHSGKREVFCEVSMGSQEQRTQAVYAGVGQEPKWNCSMQFLVKDLNEDVLCVTVKDRGLFSPNEFLGRTEIGVSEILTASRGNPGPLLKTLKLHEVNSGEIILKLDLRLFEK